MAALEDYPVLTPDDTNRWFPPCSAANAGSPQAKGEVDFSFVRPGGRFRVNAYKHAQHERRHPPAGEGIPTLDQLHMPDCLKMLAMKHAGGAAHRPHRQRQIHHPCGDVDYINKTAAHMSSPSKTLSNTCTATKTQW
jgi:hypothetical protein